MCNTCLNITLNNNKIITISYQTYIAEGFSTYTDLFRYVLRYFVSFCELILDERRTVETRSIITRRRIPTIYTNLCVTVSIFWLIDQNMN